VAKQSKPGPQPAIDLNQFLYDLSTTARLLSTNIWAVRALIKEGKLKYVRLGHAFLVAPDHIREYIQENTIRNEHAA
jgi:hypothetical protein